MELNEIQKRVVEILNNHITHDIEDNQYDKNVADELDSLDNVEIIMGLEDEFNLEIWMMNGKMFSKADHSQLLL